MGLSDYELIQNLKARYCASADHSPEDREEARHRLLALFAPDVTADYGFGEMAGGEALATFLTDAIAGGSEWIVHNLHSPQIEIAGDTAEAQWTVNVRMKRRDGTQEFVFGRYFDAFKRTVDGWRIARVRFQRYA